MPTIKLTQAAVDRKKPPATDSVTYWDSQCPGFGLRVSSRGRKTWIALYRVNGRSVMETLGTMAIIPKVDVARNLARESMTKARAGVHPVEQRRQEKAAEEAAAQAEQKTFAWLLEHQDGEIRKGFLEQFARRRQRESTLYQTERMLKRVLPVLGPKLLSDIKRSDITSVLDAIAAARQNPQNGLPTRADAEARTIQVCLNTVFRWAVAEEHMTVNPMASIAKDRYGKTQARERTLSVEEIRALWAALDQIDWPFGAIGQLLLLTGARAGEVAGMRWSELQDAGRWTLPGHRTKNGLAHIVYLSPQAASIINALPKPDNELVFTTRGTGPVTGFADAKVKVDAIMRAKLDRPLLPWVWHDLRRTVVTLMNEIGIQPHIIEACVNHVSGHKGGIAGIYNRAAYARERQDAMEAWGRYIDRLIGRGGDNNVVTLRQEIAKPIQADSQ